MMRARNLSFAASRFGCPCAQMLAGTVPFMPFVAERRVVWVTPVPHRGDRRTPGRVRHPRRLAGVSRAPVS